MLQILASTWRPEVAVDFGKPRLESLEQLVGVGLVSRPRFIKR